MQDTDRVQKQAEQIADKGMFALKEKQAAEVHEEPRCPACADTDSDERH